MSYKILFSNLIDLPLRLYFWHYITAKLFDAIYTCATKYLKIPSVIFYTWKTLKKKHAAIRNYSLFFYTAQAGTNTIFRASSKRKSPI